MMKRSVPQTVVIFFLCTVVGARYTLPGKPALTSCRSPEKETFTCWWKPGDDGGLPTTYALYYSRENSDKVIECPDYHTAGEFSCFFNKKDTSLWINYNITVVATNALGSTSSDPVDIDVVYIVQPNPPEKVSFSILEDKSLPFLRVSWEPPLKADTRSGWITLVYEIRIKLEEDIDWEMHSAGQQKFYSIFGLRSGGSYLVQVRCKPDHGFWSDWSSASSILFPEYSRPEKSMWVPIIVIVAFTFCLVTCLFHMNSSSLKHFFLPPVPGPKIKGFDEHLMKGGDSDNLFSTLVVCDFPPTTLSHYDELVVEYLEVDVPKEQELIAETTKCPHGGRPKSDDPSDSDSGHGSCDSHTLLMDKCEGTRRELNQDEGIRGMEQEKGWDENLFADDGTASPDMSSGRVKTWPSVFSPTPLSSTLEMSKQHSLSDSLLQPGVASSVPSIVCQSTQEGPEYWHFCSESHKQFHQTHGDASITSRICPRLISPDAELPTPMAKEAYVEVQRVMEENVVLLQPVERDFSGRQCPLEALEKDYSKVKRVDGEHVLLLQTSLTGEDVHMSLSLNEAADNLTRKSAASACTTLPSQEKGAVAASGYVDAATMFVPLT
ncbi:prolactin receptor a [Synchiropus picturatus]